MRHWAMGGRIGGDGMWGVDVTLHDCKSLAQTPFDISLDIDLLGDNGKC